MKSMEIHYEKLQSNILPYREEISVLLEKTNYMITVYIIKS